MAVILATMILGDAEEFQQLYGIILFSAIFFAMSNNAEIPTMKRSRDVVYFDLNVSLYSPLAYMIGVVATTLPLALVAGIIYTSIVYWSCGFSPVFSLYLYFLLVLFCLDQGIGAFLRLFSIAAKSSDVGSSITTSFIGLWILVGGFYLVRSQIPNWLSWLVWVSPFWYTLSGVAISEFNSAQYPNGQGDAYLSAFDVPDSSVLQGLDRKSVV
jgi:ABC-type multidrug transport system permease subunit